MKRLLLVLLFLWPLSALADNSSTPSKPFTFSAGTTILSSQVNSDFDTLYVGLANVGTANILAAGVGTTQLAAGAATIAKLDTTVAVALVQTGVIQDYIGTSAPAGYVRADGKTIGDASSGGTERANADTSALYSLLWSSMADAQAAVSTGRGGSAAADFAAHKTIVIPDLRGRVVAGIDNMGGTAASRLTNVATGANFDATTQGNSGGSQSHTLTTAELAVHSHGVTDPGHLHALQQSAGFQAGATATANVPSGGAGGTSTASATTGISINNAGSGTAHGIVQPVYVIYKIIKL